MGEHLVVNVDQPEASGQGLGSRNRLELQGPSSSSAAQDDTLGVIVDSEGDAGEDMPLIGMGECRICQEEDALSNLETPCACSGSLKYAHRKCVQHWCNEKGDIMCEICHQLYQPGYTAPPPPPEETNIDIGGVWTPLNIRDPRLLAIADAERQLLEAEYDDYNGMNASGAAFCRSAALILMALLLLRQALTVTDDGDVDSDGTDDASTFFSLLLLRAVGFLLPCYIMIWAISIMQRRRQRQEAAALAAARLTIMVQAAQRRGLLVGPSAPPPDSSQVNPHPDRF